VRQLLPERKIFIAEPMKVLLNKTVATSCKGTKYSTKLRTIVRVKTDMTAAIAVTVDGT
jgi:hypothetical protein